MMKIVATNVVASRSPERRPTATPTARAKSEVKLLKIGTSGGVAVVAVQAVDWQRS